MILVFFNNGKHKQSDLEEQYLVNNFFIASVSCEENIQVDRHKPCIKLTTAQFQKSLCIHEYKVVTLDNSCSSPWTESRLPV